MGQGAEKENRRLKKGNLKTPAGKRKLETQAENKKKLKEKLVYYRDEQKRVRRFDTDKAKNKKLRK